MPAEDDRKEPTLRADEGWKESVAREKERLHQEAPPGGEGPISLPEPSMLVLIAGLYTQTLMALGELENPLRGRKEKDAPEAQYLIDTIAMLQQKTEGNLTPEESSYLQNALTDLRMRYVKMAAEPAAEQTGGQAT